MSDKLVSDAFTYRVIGCAYEAFKFVGAGFDETHYHIIFHELLHQHGIQSKYKVPVQLCYRNMPIAQMEIDELVENRLIIELKCLQSGFLAHNFAQILTYLKVMQLNLGYLINFGLHKAQPKRIIYEEKRIKDVHQWDSLFYKNPDSDNIVKRIIHAIRRVDKELGVAYHEKIYKSALEIEFAQSNIFFNNSTQVNLSFNSYKFNSYSIDYWLVENRILLGILTGTTKPRAYDFIRMRNYLKKLKLTHGLISYWSTKNLQLYGIYEP